MTFTAADPVVSGCRYSIAEVDGHTPTALTDFTAVAQLTLVRDGEQQRLIGAGAATANGVRFHQKDPGPDDRDVRAWTITEQGDGTFVAHPVAAF
jgi:hypothetical protein